MTPAQFNDLMERYLDAPLGIRPDSDFDLHIEHLFDDWIEDEVDSYIDRCLNASCHPIAC